MSSFIPFNNLLSHTKFEQFTIATTTYSTFVVDREMQFCFLLVQDTSLLPKKKAHPLVIFFSSKLLAQSASMKRRCCCSVDAGLSSILQVALDRGNTPS